MDTVSYEPVIGLEVHCQLQTASKLFSPESTAYGAEPNTSVDPISLGHPGTLPILNRQAVRYALRMGLATHCSIAERSVFARKHYFYPDLPKGYQISQYETPLCFDGYVDVPRSHEEAQKAEGGEIRRIRIRRIHLEEDAGKSLHDQHPKSTLLDFNRCGVPLIEIVTEPDFRSPEQAYHYMQKIRQIVRYLGICDGNMEEGSLRCDANVSVRLAGVTELGTKTEVKNMNSFRHVEQALSYEIGRQIRLIESGEEVVQETLLWDADRGATRSMRSKEEAHDYRYFPDPDLVPVVVTDDLLRAIRDELPEMPEERRTRFLDELGLPAYDAALLTEERKLADYFEETLRVLTKANEGDVAAHAKAVSNMVMTEVRRVLKERDMTIEHMPIEPERLAGLVHLRLEDAISSSAAQDIFNTMLEDRRTPDKIAETENLLQVGDVDALEPFVDRVLEQHEQEVQQYLGGKTGLLGFFIGQVMRGFEGSPDPKVVRELLTTKLDALREQAMASE